MLLRLVMVFLLLLCSAPPAWACDIGYCVTSTVPANAATDVPLDTKIYVYFNTTPGLGEPEGSLTLVEKSSGQGLLASVTVVDGINPAAEVHNRVAILEPLLSLAADTEYEVVFGEGSVCTAPELVFTTGSDFAPAPVFAGATSATATCLVPPEQRTDCDDDDAFPRIRFEFEATPGADVAGYRVYRDGNPLALLPKLPAGAQLLPEDALARECFMLRAVGLNGMESPGGEEVCASTDVCVAAPGEDMGVSDMGVSDMGGADTGAVDQGTADTGSGVDDMMPDTDAQTPSMDVPLPEAGCCSTTKAEPPLWLIAGLIVFGVRRRR